MKRLVCIGLSLLFLLVCTVSAHAADSYVVLDGFAFDLDGNGGAVIHGYDDREADIAIPAELLGAKVVRIDSYAFYQDKSLASVSFDQAAQLTAIGDSAFSGCGSLTELSLPALEELGFGAFQNCTGLRSLTIANGLTVIPAQAFYGCSMLESVTLPGSVTTIGSYAFGNCTALGRVTIPASVTAIADSAFYNCAQLVIFCTEDSAAHLYARENGISFKLTGSRDIAAATVTLEADAARYDGRAHCPAVTVINGETTLKNNVDYSLEYVNHTAVGTATVRVVGCYVPFRVLSRTSADHSASFAKVSFPAIPSAYKPPARWKALTARSV